MIVKVLVQASRIPKRFLCVLDPETTSSAHLFTCPPADVAAPPPTDAISTPPPLPFSTADGVGADALAWRCFLPPHQLLDSLSICSPGAAPAPGLTTLWSALLGPPLWSAACEARYSWPRILRKARRVSADSSGRRG